MFAWKMAVKTACGRACVRGSAGFVKFFLTGSNGDGVWGEGHWKRGLGRGSAYCVLIRNVLFVDGFALSSENSSSHGVREFSRT